MKILGKHWYIVSSPVKISADKIKALADGKAHIHGDPVRKPVVVAEKEVAHA